MIVAWIDEKKMDGRLEYFCKEYLGSVQTFMGKSLRPFNWTIDNPRHVFGLGTFMAFLASIEILVLTGAEKTTYKNLTIQGNTIRLQFDGTPLILFGNEARHAIQLFNFAHVETHP